MLNNLAQRDKITRPQSYNARTHSKDVMRAWAPNQKNPLVRDSGGSSGAVRSWSVGTRTTPDNDNECLTKKPSSACRRGGLRGRLVLGKQTDQETDQQARSSTAVGANKSSATFPRHLDNANGGSPFQHAPVNASPRSQLATHAQGQDRLEPHAHGHQTNDMFSTSDELSIQSALDAFIPIHRTPSQLHGLPRPPTTTTKRHRREE